MSAFDIAEGRILIALFIAHHGERREILTWEEIEARYHTKVSKMQFEAIVGELERHGVAKVFRDKDGSGALLLDHGVRFAHDRILKFLDADIFDVNWQGERILTDAPEGTDVPCPNGWMLLHTAKVEQKARRPAAPVESLAAPAPHGISAGRDVIMNVGSPGAQADASTRSGRQSESGWVKWQTILAAIGVVVAVFAIVVTVRLAGG